MQDVADTQQAVQAATPCEPQNAAQEPAQGLGGRILDEAGGQLLTEIVGALVRGAPQVAADCAGAVAGAAGTVAGAVADGVNSL